MSAEKERHSRSRRKNEQSEEEDGGGRRGSGRKSRTRDDVERHRDRDGDRDKDRDRGRDRDRDREREKERERRREKVRESERERGEKEREKDKERGKEKGKEKEKDKERGKRREREKDRDDDRVREREKSRGRSDKESRQEKEKRELAHDEKKIGREVKKQKVETNREKNSEPEVKVHSVTNVSSNGSQDLSEKESVEESKEGDKGEEEHEEGNSEADAEQTRLNEEMEKRRKRVQEWQEKRRLLEEEAELDRMEKAKLEGIVINATQSKNWTLDGEDSDEGADGNEQTGEQTEEVAVENSEEKKEVPEEMAAEEEDPLDAFMNSIVAPEVKKVEERKPEASLEFFGAFAAKAVKKRPNKPIIGGGFFKIPLKPVAASKAENKPLRKKKPLSLRGRIMGESDSGSDADVEEENEDEGAEKEEDDAEFLKRMSEKGSKIDKLPPVDHSTVNYAPFRKHFYIEVKEISRMTEEEVLAYRKEHEFKLRGKEIPRPVKTWTQTGLNNKILEVIKKQGWDKPMPIQAQALPIIMSGRDCIGIAKTGSGKTMAFVLPMLRHILAQPQIEMGDGPIAMVFAPTRELVHQIHTDIKRFAKALDLSVVAVYGGGGVAAQIGELKRGAHIVVCTPGRMIDILCTGSGKITNLRRVTYLVMDEADRMFDMGFEPQITRMVQNTRPDRQTVLFSATFPRQVEALARKVLTRPIEIQVGGRSVVNTDITQRVEIREDAAEERFLRLLELLGEWYEKGKVLVFVHSQEKCDSLFTQLMAKGYPCLSLHGAKEQADRESTLSDFKSGVASILIATSVAARGLDVRDLELVVNYDVPNHYEDYVHRVGRTGRAGKKGHAVTFIAPAEERYAPDLVRALELSAQEVPDDLRQLAEGFKAKLKSGEEQGHGSGYGGSGFKFNEEEEEKRKQAKKALAKEYLGTEAGDSDSESDSEGIRRVDGPMGSGPTAQGAAAVQEALQKARAAASKALPGGSASGQSAGGEDAAPGPGAAMALTAQQQIQALVAQRLAAAGVPAGSLQVAAAAPMLSGGLPIPGLGLPGGLEGMQAGMGLLPGALAGNEGASKAAAFAAQLNLQHSLAKIQEMGIGGSLPGKEHFEAEFEINDLSQHARWRLTHKETLGQISEWSGAAITTRGLYVALGRNPPPGEKKLFLFIEGPTAESVRKAKTEIKRVLEESAAGAPSHSHHQPGKYSL